MKSLPSGWKYSIGLIVSILLLFAANLWARYVFLPAQYGIFCADMP